MNTFSQDDDEEELGCFARTLFMLDRYFNLAARYVMPVVVLTLFTVGLAFFTAVFLRFFLNEDLGLLALFFGVSVWAFAGCAVASYLLAVVTDPGSPPLAKSHTSDVSKRSYSICPLCLSL